MATANAWPARDYDFRQDPVSLRWLETPTMKTIVQLCDHYTEKLDFVCKKCGGIEVDQENKALVLKYISLIRLQTKSLADQDEEFFKNVKKVRKIQEEFDILKAGDLEDDPERSPKLMHDQLVQIEGEYGMLIDTIESYKRRIRNLEASLEDGIDKRLY